MWVWLVVQCCVAGGRGDWWARWLVAFGGGEWFFCFLLQVEF